MAIFGFHVVLTLLTATIFSKLSFNYIFCDFFLFKGLFYYLLQGSLLPKNSINNRNEQIRRRKKNIPKENTKEERLFRLPLTCNALEGVPFFDSLVWTMNFNCFAILVYVITDIFDLVFSENEDFNTSLVWIFCAFILQIHVSMRIAFEKARSKELYAERNTMICVLGISFLGSMLLNVFCDKILDTNFIESYTAFVDSLNQYVTSQGFSPLFTEHARSPLLFLICLALLFSIIATSFFFPVVQFASLYLDSLDECSIPLRVLLKFSFFAPAAALILFLRPVAEQILDNQMLTYEQLKTARILLIFLMVLLRVLIAKTCLQTFLDQPKKKIFQYLQQQLKDEEREKKVVSFASYTCVTSLQYYLPVLTIFFTTLILKKFGNFSFLSIIGKESLNDKHFDESHHLTKIIQAIQEPFWTLTLITFLSTQFLVSIVGVIGKRSS